MEEKKLDKRDIEDILPLTPMQEGMLYHYLKNSSSDIYFEQIGLRISSNIDIGLFEKAWEFVIQTNEMLRTIFRWQRLEKPVQIVLKNREFKSRYYDFSRIEGYDKNIKVKEIKKLDKEEGFDIAIETFRITLCKLSDMEFEIIISNHHILFDGWSTGIILKEFFNSYEKLYNNQPLEVIKKNKFKNYIVWCKRRDKSEEKKFWQTYLKGLELKSLLPLDYKGKNFKADSFKYKLPEDVTGQIKEFVKTKKITFAPLLYCAWGLLLQKYSYTEDIAFGATVSGRTIGIDDIDNMVGLFINTLPIRIKSDSSKTCWELLEEINSTLSFINQYSYPSLTDIKSYVASEDSNSAFFDSIVVIENYPLDKALNEKSNILKVNSYLVSESTNYDLALGIDTSDGLEVKYIYNSCKFNPETITRIAEHFVNIISQIIDRTDRPLSEINMLTKEEKNNIIYSFNNTKVSYHEKSTICSLFEKQAAKTPRNISVTYKGEMLTYGELNSKSNQLARILREKGVGRNTIVGLMIEPSLELIIGIMSVLKAGGVYLPIDPDYPDERIQYMLEDSKAEILLIGSNTLKDYKYKGITLSIDDNIFTGDDSNLESINSVDDMVYVIYTSGSTGKPKGVMIEHKSLINFIYSIYKSYKQQLGIKDNCLFSTNICFDVSVCEIFLPLVFGAQLVVAEKDRILDANQLAQIIIEKSITFAYIPPSLLGEVYKVLKDMDKPTSLNKLLVGVEPIKDFVLENYLTLNDSMIIINGYGPTETTICATLYPYHSRQTTGRNVSIGKPMANARVYIIDKYNNPLCIGAIGELYISGSGVARGYLNKVELSQEKFIPDPFNQGERMYKTGDLAKWLPDGNIEFIGRVDYQVKIRGYRIELGEIESTLGEHNLVKKAVVLDKKDSYGNGYLCAYIVSEIGVTIKTLREYLSIYLPHYMIPTQYIFIDKIPLTSNGKINRNYLLQLNNVTAKEKDYIPPISDTEKRLAVVWERVLEIENASVNDNFFEDGGHSLKAMMLVSRIHKEFDIEINIGDLFKYPTIRELSEQIEKTLKNIYFPIIPESKREYYPVSSAQKRMFVLNQLDKSSLAYNMAGGMVIEGNLDVEVIARAFKIIVERHEVLRTAFKIVKGEPIQYISTNIDVNIEYLRASDENLKEISKDFLRPFDLNTAPLFRVGLIEITKKRHLLLIDIHHIISDGVSVGILIKELQSIMLEIKLPKLNIQYKDYSIWQNKLLKENALEKQERYWLDIFSGEMPVLDLPYDFPRPVIQSFDGECISFCISKELADKITDLTRKTGSTLYMVLLAAFNVLLSKYSGMDDIVVGTPIAARTHADLHNLLGMFANTLALRNCPEGSKTFVKFLDEVKENVIQAYENQDYPLEMIVEKLKLPRDSSRNQLFDVMLVMEEVEAEPILVNNLKFESYELENNSSKFDITLMATENKLKGIIEFNIQYCSALFKPETIQKIKEHFVNILDNVTKEPEVALTDINILTESERHLLLYDFNNTKEEYPKNSTIHGIFEGRVRETPGKTAVIFEDKVFTYSQIDEKANKLAKTLKKANRGQGRIIAIMCEPSAEMIIGILAVLKTGKAYLPIDPDYPDERISYMLEDSGVEILLVQSHLADRILFNGSIINIEDKEEYLDEDIKIDTYIESKTPAYVIYTSGSTGKPKGVLVSHRSVINTLTHLEGQYPVTEEDTYLLKTAYTFDVSVTELFGWFFGSGKLAILKKTGNQNPTDIIEAIYKYNITHINFVPSMLNIFTNALREEDIKRLESIKYVFTAGEPISQNIIKNLLNKLKNIRFDNLYGPTEATIYATGFCLNGFNKHRSIPIGKPLQNTRIYIVDKYNNLQPVGVIGELCIAGEGVALGYLNNDELERGKFVKDPFVEEGRMYKTGDLARWLKNGNIEFHGRVDYQVKIRGFRVEIGEIESRLIEHKDIKEAKVLCKEDSQGIKYLSGYIVSDKNNNLLELRNYLSKYLPNYMIPSYFKRLDKMPLNISGKINTKLLHHIGNEIAIETSYQAPKSLKEQTLAEIFSQVLGIEKIGINDNFFALGGHSLKATFLTAKIKAVMGIDVLLKEIFLYPTVKMLCKAIDSREINPYSMISTATKREYYPVSAAQRRMYLLDKLEENSTNYNIPVAVMIEGKVNIEDVNIALKKLIHRHEIMRTSFAALENEIVQYIHREVDINVKYIDMSCRGSEGVNNIISKLITPFNIAKAPLFRVALIKVEEYKHILFYDAHHIICDGVSMTILIDELMRMILNKELPQLKIQYKDYAVWQNNPCYNKSISRQEEYWLNVFNRNIPALNLPTDYPRPLLQSFDGDSIELKLGAELSQKIKSVCNDENTTSYILMLAAYNVLLLKYTGQEDIVVGTPIAGRYYPDLEDIVGVFVNTLAMRNYPRYNMTFRELLEEVKKNALDAYENQHYPFELLVDKLNIKRDISRNPIFDTMFSVQHIDINSAAYDDYSIMQYKLKTTKSKFDLMIEVMDTGKEMTLCVDYCTKLFRKETVLRITQHYKRIVETILQNLEIKISDIDLLTGKEKNMILNCFNDTSNEYYGSRIIHELFEQQVEKTPENIAVICASESISYRELNEKANKIARCLRQAGVKPNSVVGIIAKPSFEMIIGIMGILKSGGAYMPIDPEYPRERIEYMLKDSKADVLLTSSDCRRNYNLHSTLIAVEDGISMEMECTNLPRINRESDLAYIIYTSGSTGKPKGVMIEHKNVTSYVAAFRYEFNITEKDTVLQQSTFCFDTFIEEVFPVITTGGKLVVVTKYEALDVQRLRDIINKENISLVSCTPLFINELNKYIDTDTIHTYISGGDVLKSEYITNIIKKAKVYNTYGPTEGTVCATYYCCIGNERYNIPIGKPILNYRVYILDAKRMLVPIGVPGELWIAGAGVARGYLGRPELTEEKFISDPYVKGDRMYNTGDIAKWLPDGNIEFIGRLDDQIKIRGYRIELGEIEDILLKHEKIKEAVVVGEEAGKRGKVLFAYFTSDEKINCEKFKNYLSQELPQYMIPNSFLQLDKIPLNSNGKINRNQLPKPEKNLISETDYAEPKTVIEEGLVKIWEDLLEVKDVGIDHNFFELGGHSLKAMSLVARIHKEMNVAIPLRDIFRFQTVRTLSRCIEAGKSEGHKPIQPVRKDYYPMSSSQKRMFILWTLEDESITYNISGAFIIKGKLQIEQLEEAFKVLIQRHDILRTHFGIVDGEPIQYIKDVIDFSLDYEVLNNCGDIEYKEIEKMLNGFVRPFNLEKTPLLRAKLVKLLDDKHILMLDIHHIIADGISVQLLIKEITDILQNKDLSKPLIHYKDYSVWQNKMLHADIMKKKEKYWLEVFKGDIPVLNMPTDFTRPRVQSYKGDNVSIKLDSFMTRKIQIVTRENEATLHMVLLSAFNILLSKYSGQEDIIVGLPIAGRQHADLHNMIGMFVNTIAVRNYPIGNKTYKEFLNEIKENAIIAYENGDYQFEELVEKLKIPRDLGRNPLFDVMFEVQNIEEQEKSISMGGLTFIPCQLEDKTAKFDITLKAVVNHEDIDVMLQYNTELYTKKRMVKMLEHFANILERIVDNTEISLSQIDMLTYMEKHKILSQFNDTGSQSTGFNTYHSLFEEQTERTPDNIAVEFGNRSLSYRELNEKANQIGAFLINIGAGNEEPVAVLMERSDLFVQCVIGIWKAGGFYIPIEPNYPVERIKTILDNSKARFVLTSSEYVSSKLEKSYKGDLIKLDTLSNKINSMDRANLNVNVNEKNLAYVIYTSGSTGTPKGAMIEHAGMINHMYAMINQLELDKNSVIVQNASHCFDISVWQFFNALILGAKTVIYDKDLILDPQRFIKQIIKDGATVLEVVPSFITVVMDYLEINFKKLEDLKYLLVTGETVKPAVIKRWLKLYPGIKTVNAYGPAEASDDVTLYIIDQPPKGDSISIGKPIQNLKIYIVDQYMNLCPEGVCGEICVGGVGVGRGYLNDEERTRSSFMPDPFSNIKGARLYKTGDLGTWLSDGNIEFSGRRDYQVKIGGYRIELSEIEARLINYPDMKEVVVIDRMSKNQVRYLCAYMVSDMDIDLSSVKGYLAEKLPYYMIPSYFIQLEKMPINANGKIDRKSLLSLEIKTRTDKPAIWRDETEKRLSLIWARVLGIDNKLIDSSTNFFEIGGNSLKAISLISNVYKEFNVKIPFVELFKEATIATISQHIKKSVTTEYRSIVPAEQKEFYELSSAQKRLYVIQQRYPNSISYNVPTLIILEGDINIERLENTFKQLIDRHESLRTSFEIFEDEPKQRIWKEVDFKLEYYEAGEGYERKIVENFIAPFDLRNTPLIRAGLIKRCKSQYVLMVDVHHIVFDGFSSDILVRDFTRLYMGEQLPNLRIQYKDFSEWQNRLLQSEEIKSQEEYWVSKFKGGVSSLNLSTNPRYIEHESPLGETIYFKIDRDLTMRLKQYTLTTQTTLYIVLLSAYSILMSKYSGQKDIVVGSPIAGRTHPDLEDMLGMFVNMLAMRNQPDENKEFSKYLKEVKSDVLLSFENSDYQFEELVHKLNLERVSGKNPLFNVVFALQNMDKRDLGELKIPGLKVMPYEYRDNAAKFDLLLNGIERDDFIEMSINYDSSLFKRDVVEMMAKNYIEILSQILSNDDVKIRDIIISHNLLMTKSNVDLEEESMFGF